MELKKSEELLGNDVVEAFIDKFNMRGHKTDPALIQDILEKDLHLGDSELLKSTFHDEFNIPQELDPMLDKVALGLHEKHPAVVEFLVEADKRGLINYDGENSDLVIRILNYSFILEKITEKVTLDYRWGEQLFNFFFDKRAKMGIPKGVFNSFRGAYRIAGRWFVAAKLASIELVALRYIKRMNKKKFEPGSLGDKWNQKTWIAMLNLNIYEATMQDFFVKKNGNSEAGFVLTSTTTDKVTCDGQVLYHHTQGWASLYHTWNLCFITQDLPHLDLMYPKLLIPVVSNATGDYYIHARAIALVITFNMMTLRMAKNIPSPFEVPNKEELSEIWSEINRKYARELLASDEKERGNRMGFIKKFIYKRMYF
ncbi:hypothetical protein [Veronia pacifica]|uniref:Uncharacterized protein n=1 Tax=Veronia pacifica TaxID=1080227 RepID=A0A1C3EKY7_9GAMM|nr:hypothetical protein [Veronia pacifica]ODA33901.1 hypothetical protein A8L45_08780 [Veronia pacifica]